MRWRPATTSHSQRRGNGRALYRPVDLDRDQSYFLFATTREQLDFLRFPLGAMTKAETRAGGARARPRRRRQARQPGHLLRAERPLCRRDRAAEAGRGRGRRHRPHRRARARPPRRHHPLHRRPAARHRRRRRRAALRRPSRPGRPARDRRPARGADDAAAASPRGQLARRRRRSASCRRTGIDDLRPRPLDAAAAAGPSLARRRPRSSSTSADGEAGVAPGQACVFYEGDGAGARVLGGGFIARAERAAEAEQALRRLVAPAAVQATV